MTQRPDNNFKRLIVSNLLWFSAAFALAFFVWILASTQADPVSEQRFRTRIPINIELEDGMTVVEQQTSNVWVTVRAQSSVQENLTAEDIIVSADLSGHGPGTYTVELQTELARRGLADTQPRQITVTIEEIQVQQVQVIAEIPPDRGLPPNFISQSPSFSESQVTVRGVSSRVQQVVAARALLDLRGQRDTLRDNVRLVPVNADGDIVLEVDVEPQFVEVVVEIRQREDLREVSVSPSIAAGTLPDGYTLSAISYEPQTVFLIGSRDELSGVSTPLRTTEIDLSGRTQPFEISVPIVFGQGEVFPILGDANVTVFLEIMPLTDTRQFDNIPIELIGVENGLVAEASLESVVVLVTGPAPLVRDLQADMIRVIVDVSDLASGTYDLTPRAILPQTQIDPSGITVNPATITVTIAPADESESS